jgi:hypothetical protein
MGTCCEGTCSVMCDLITELSQAQAVLQVAVPALPHIGTYF